MTKSFISSEANPEKIVCFVDTARDAKGKREEARNRCILQLGRSQEHCRAQNTNQIRLVTRTAHISIVLCDRPSDGPRNRRPNKLCIHYLYRGISLTLARSPKIGPRSSALPHLLRHRQPLEGVFPRELPLERVGGVIGTEHFRRQARHQRLQMLVQDADIVGRRCGAVRYG